MSKFSENSPESFAINEAYELEKQPNYVGFDDKSCSGWLQRKHSFRVWHVLLFLFFVAAIIVLVILLSPGVLRKKKAATSNDASAQGKSTLSPAENKSSKGVSSTTEPAIATQPQGTTAKLPSTEGPDMECGVVIVGGGVGGLLLAYMLLVKKVEASVCIFEKENRLGGDIYDHFFSQASDISVGLGHLVLLGDNDEESRAVEDVLNFDDVFAWARDVTRLEARGVFADDFDRLQQSAFPTTNRSGTVKDMAINASKANSSLYSTAGDFLSDYLSPEGRELLEDAYGLKNRLYDVNPESYKKYLKEKLSDEENRPLDTRPRKGLSEIVWLLENRVNQSNGSIYFPETVTSVMKEGSSFFLQTTNRTVRANKVVLTVEPAALKDITGDVMQNITNHKILRSIVSVPAFFGAALYQTPWWKDGKAVKTMSDKNMFISSSNCLGITMPYMSTNSKGVLQTIANEGSCSDEWGSKLKISVNNDVIDREMKRALEYKFQRKIPDALSTVYKYWENGFWYLQKAGTNFSLEEIRDWAKRPLPGSDVFLVGKAFYNFGGWLEDTIRSTNETLVEGWKTELKL